MRTSFHTLLRTPHQAHPSPLKSMREMEGLATKLECFLAVDWQKTACLSCFVILSVFFSDLTRELFDSCQQMDKTVMPEISTSVQHSVSRNLIVSLK